MFSSDWEASVPHKQKLKVAQQQHILGQSHSLRIHLLPLKIFEIVMCPKGSEDVRDDSTICSSPLDHAIQDYRFSTHSFGNSTVQYNIYRDIIDLKHSEQVFLEKFHSISRPWTSKDYSYHFLSHSSLAPPLINENHKHFQTQKRYLRFGEEFKTAKILSNTISGMDVEFDIAWAIVREQLVDHYEIKRLKNFSNSRQGKNSFAGSIARKRHQYYQKRLFLNSKNSSTKDLQLSTIFDTKVLLLYFCKATEPLKDNAIFSLSICCFVLYGLATMIACTTSLRISPQQLIKRAAEEISRCKTTQVENQVEIYDTLCQAKKKKKKKKATAKNSIKLEEAEFSANAVDCSVQEFLTVRNNSTLINSIVSPDEATKPEELFKTSIAAKLTSKHSLTKKRGLRSTSKSVSVCNASRDPSLSCTEGGVSTDELTSSSTTIIPERDVTCTLPIRAVASVAIDPLMTEDTDFSSFIDHSSLTATSFSTSIHQKGLGTQVYDNKTPMKKLLPERSVSIQENLCSMTPTKEQREKAYMELKRFQAEQIGRLVKLKKEINIPGGKCDKSSGACEQEIASSTRMQDSFLFPNDFDCTRLLAEILDTDEDDTEESSFSKGEETRLNVKTMISIFAPPMSPMSSIIETADPHDEEDAQGRQVNKNGKCLYSTDSSLFFWTPESTRTFHGDSWDRFSELSQGSTITTAKAWISNEASSSFLTNVKW